MDLTKLFNYCLRAAYCFNKTSNQARFSDSCQAGLTMRNAKATYHNVTKAMQQSGFSLQQSYMKNISTGIGSPHILYVARYLDSSEQNIVCASILEDKYIGLTTVTLSIDMSVELLNQDLT